MANISFFFLLNIDRRIISLEQNFSLKKNKKKTTTQHEDNILLQETCYRYGRVCSRDKGESIVWSCNQSATGPESTMHDDVTRIRPPRQARFGVDVY